MTNKNEEIKGEEKESRTMTMEDLEQMIDENKNNQDENIPWFEKNESTNMKNKENNSSLREQVNAFKKHTTKDNNDLFYSFKIEEIIDLEKHLKSKIFGQDKAIQQIIDNMLMYTYRTKNNEINAGVYLQFGPSGSGKNFIWEVIAEKLGFELEIVDISAMHFCEASSFLGVTSGYGYGEEGILESIYERARENNGKVILIFDEFDKGQVTQNGNCATFLTSIMSLLSNKSVRTKDSNTEIILSNFIFVFNSNYGFDNFKIEEEKMAKIGFDIDDKNKEEENKNYKYQITTNDIESYFKKNLKVQVSVYNRLKKADNIIIFNEIDNQILEDYKLEKYEELKEEIIHYLGVKKNKIPKLNYFYDKFEKFDTTGGFRLLNNIIFQEIKLILIKKFGLKRKVENFKIKV